MSHGIVWVGFTAESWEGCSEPLVVTGTRIQCQRAMDDAQSNGLTKAQRKQPRYQWKPTADFPGTYERPVDLPRTVETTSGTMVIPVGKAYVKRMKITVNR